MKTYNNLYDQICSFENIYKAYLKARKGKRYHREVLRFSCNLEENLIRIRTKLINKIYRTGKYKLFTIYEPKERLIAALPFEDRVVQHALCNIIEKLFEKSFIYDSHACRKGFGVLSGVLRTTKFRRAATQFFNTDNIYCLKCDISKYFYSIDHNILKKLIRKKIKCCYTLDLIDEIIDSSGKDIGMPIGNLTSQLFANVYLNQLDHFVKDHLKTKYYIRYMDDFVILNNKKKYLQFILISLKEFLYNILQLKLNISSRIFPVKYRPINFLGYIIYFNHRLLRKSNIKRTKKKFKKFQKLYQQNKISLNTIKLSIMSWLGHIKWADSYILREKLLSQLVFVRIMVS